jgi:hypothetical protein
MTPSCTVDDFNENSMTTCLIFLTYSQGDNSRKGTGNVEEGVILSSAQYSRVKITFVIRANQAVLRVFKIPWKRIKPMNTATVWLFVGVYSKSVLIDTAARVI